MWFIKHKKLKPENSGFSPSCAYCNSTNTKVVTRYNAETPDYVKIWRGQRYITCRCFNCGKDFYTNEPEEGLNEEAMYADEIVSDPEELRAAEEELVRDIQDTDDRRCL